MRAGAEVARHLHRQHPLRRQGREQARQQPVVIVEPVQCRIRKDEAGRPLRPPCREIGVPPLDPGVLGSRLGKHFGGAVDADDSRRRPACGNQPRHIAGTGAEVIHTRRRRQVDALQQVERRPQPRAGEFQVLGGIPRHLSLCLRVAGQAGSKADRPIRARQRCDLIPVRSRRSPSCQPIRLRRANAAAVHGSNAAHGTNGLRLP